MKETLYKGFCNWKDYRKVVFEVDYRGLKIFVKNLIDLGHVRDTD